MPTPLGARLRPAHLQVRPMRRVHEDHQMTPEDEEFNRIEREAKQRMEAVKATIAPSEWVGLTHEERKAVRDSVRYSQFMTAGEYAELVQKVTESALREKNT